MLAVRLSLVLLALAAAVPGAAAGQPTGRADDLEVRNQIDQVDRVLDRFLGGLDARARSGPVASLHTLVARIASTYRPPSATAVATVTEFLRLAKAFEVSLDTAQPQVQAAWGEVVPWLADLGRSYRVNWKDDPRTWAPRRVTDQELQLAATSLAAAGADAASILRDVLKRDKVMDGVEKDRTVRQLDELTRASAELRKVVVRRQDVSTAETRAVKAVAALKPFFSSYPGCHYVQGQWESVQRTLETISAAYGS